MKYTEDNREQLARDVVDGWDMDTLIDFAIGNLILNYELDEKAFDCDVDIMAN